MEKINMSFVSLQRILRVTARLVEAGGEVNQYEINTLHYLFKQCDHDEQQHMIKKYGDTLPFLK